MPWGLAGKLGTRNKKFISALAAVHVVLLIYTVVLYRFFPSAAKWRRTTAKGLYFVNASAVPEWLLFRSVRSAILLTEKKFSQDFDFIGRKEDLGIIRKECRSQIFGEGQYDICNISLSLTLRDYDLSLESYAFDDATRSRTADEQSCKIVMPDGTNLPSQIQQATHWDVKGRTTVTVECQDLKLLESSLILVFSFLQHEQVRDYITSWLEEIASSPLPFPLHVMISASTTTLSLAVEALRSYTARNKICVSIVQLYRSHNQQEVFKTVDFCPQQLNKRASVIFWMTDDASYHCKHKDLHADEATKKEHASRARAVKNCLISAALRAALRHVNGSRAYDYILLQDTHTFVCRGAMARLFQAVMSLRRTFSAIRCGPATSCLLLHAKDAYFWAEQMDNSGASAEEILFHVGQALSPAGQRYFQDAGILVTHEALLRSASPSSPGGGSLDIRCGMPMTRNSFAQTDHDEDLYLEGSGCVPSIDFLSPCVDERKAVEFLARPHWFRHFPEPNVSISVQVLTNDRPAVLYRTILKLIEQTRAECVTIHVDGVNEYHLTSDQRSTLKLVRWLARMYGVRWRRNPDSFFPGFTRRTGFRRNYEEMRHDKHEVSSTDRLVHMTWSALAFAFERTPHQSFCTVNSTVILEDDLLPAPDMMSYFSFGLEMMEQDPKIKIVSAWNDNSFNIREGLACAVQRGEFFMGLGWLTIRPVYEDLVTNLRRWPLKTEAETNVTNGHAFLSIQGGWERPFLNLFEEQGVGIFPVMNRVSHQPSARGWSSSELLQTQLLDAVVIKPSGPHCNFKDVSEQEYERNLAASILDGTWIDFESAKCYKDLLRPKQSQTFVVALQDTNLGWSLDFSDYFLPFSWIRGFAKTRGSYKDTVLIHAAHHLFVILGPLSYLKNHPVVTSKFEKAALSREQALQFFNESCTWTSIQSSAKGSMSRKGTDAVTLHLADPGQDCDSACHSMGQVCRSWAAIYTNVGMNVVLEGGGGSRVPVRREVSPASKPYMLPYGHVIPHTAWKHLPALGGDGVIELGLPRLFRCDTPAADQGSRRVCPCLDASLAAEQGARGLF